MRPDDGQSQLLTNQYLTRHFADVVSGNRVYLLHDILNAEYLPGEYLLPAGPTGHAALATRWREELTYLASFFGRSLSHQRSSEQMTRDYQRVSSRLAELQDLGARTRLRMLTASCSVTAMSLPWIGERGPEDIILRSGGYDGHLVSTLGAPLPDDPGTGWQSCFKDSCSR